MNFTLHSFNQEQVQICAPCFIFPVSSILSTYCLPLNLCLPEEGMRRRLSHESVCSCACVCSCVSVCLSCVTVSVHLCVCVMCDMSVHLCVSVMCDCVVHVFCLCVCPSQRALLNSTEKTMRGRNRTLYRNL